MQYMGGKSRTWKQICAFLNSVRKPGRTYLEPFVGGAWVLQGMAGNRIASDANRALITMYKALQEGWIPPEYVTQEEYTVAKSASDDDPIKAFCGIGYSWGGKWWGGYADPKSDKNHLGNPKYTLFKKLAHMKGVDFRYGDYRQYTPQGSLIYLDPPYAETTSYGATGGFDSTEFWNVVRTWSQNNTVVISEYKAPDDFECVLSMPTKIEMRSKNGREDRVEKLFMHHSIAVLPNVVQGSLF